MTSFKDLLDGINILLARKREDIGINSTEGNVEGERVVTIGNPPGCVTLLVDVLPVSQQGKVLYFDVSFAVLCIAGSKASAFESLDEAMSIARAVLDELAGQTVAGCYIGVKDQTIEVISLHSDATVVGVLFETQVQP